MKGKHNIFYIKTNFTTLPLKILDKSKVPLKITQNCVKQLKILKSKKHHGETFSCQHSSATTRFIDFKDL